MSQRSKLSTFVFPKTRTRSNQVTSRTTCSNYQLGQTNVSLPTRILVNLRTVIAVEKHIIMILTISNQWEEAHTIMNQKTKAPPKS